MSILIVLNLRYLPAITMDADPTIPVVKPCTDGNFGSYR